MSRHTREVDGHEVVVGWDSLLGTFFGQVFDANDDDDGTLVWVGLPPERIYYVADLMERLGEPWRLAIDRQLANILEAESHKCVDGYAEALRQIRGEVNAYLRVRGGADASLVRLRDLADGALRVAAQVREACPAGGEHVLSRDGTECANCGMLRPKPPREPS